MSQTHSTICQDCRGTVSCMPLLIVMSNDDSYKSLTDNHCWDHNDQTRFEVVEKDSCGKQSFLFPTLGEALLKYATCTPQTLPIMVPAQAPIAQAQAPIAVPTNENGVCHFFQKNTCRNGHRCLYRHVKICTFFKSTDGCRNGTDCPFLHE